MPANQDFKGIIITNAQSHKDRQPTHSWSLFPTKATATANFMDDLKKAGVVWAKQSTLSNNLISVHIDHNTASNARAWWLEAGHQQCPGIFFTEHAIALALFKYCLARNPAETDSLYNNLIKALQNPSSNTVTNYTVNQDDQNKFYKEVLSLLKNTKTLMGPILLINDILVLIDNLFSSYPDADAKKAQLLIDSGFIQNHLIPNLSLGENPILDNPVIKKAFELQPALGTQVLETLEKQFTLFPNGVIKAWQQLLKNKSIPVTATLSGKNFMQYWLSHDPQVLIKDQLKEELGPATTLLTPWAHIPYSHHISQLIEREAEIFPGFDDETKGALWSLCCWRDYKAGTPLQGLARAYEYQPALIEPLIIHLVSTPHISLENEKDDYWFEILFSIIKDASAFERILKAVDNNKNITMLQKFYEEELHLRPSLQLAAHLSKIDFWTRTHEENTENHVMILLHARTYILKGAPDQANKKDIDIPEQRIIENFTTNLARAIQYNAAQTSESQDAPDALDNFLTGMPTLFNEIKEQPADISDDYYKKQFSRVKPDVSINKAYKTYLAVYFITNFAQYHIRRAINSELYGDHLEYVPNSLKALNLNSRLKDYGKNQISRSIQKSLETYLAKEFSCHPMPGKNSEAMIHNFISLNQYLELILTKFNLTFKEIILANPVSASILQNICLSMLPFISESGNAMQPLRKTVLFKSIPSNVVYNNTTVSDLEGYQNFVKALSAQVPQYTGESLLSTSTAKDAIQSMFLGTTDKTNIKYARLIRDIVIMENASERILARNCMLVIIDYRISSFKRDKYLKQFYQECLTPILATYPAGGMTSDFIKAHGAYFIAQVNTSLGKLVPKNYAAAGKAQALIACIEWVFTTFNLTLNDLDPRVQNSYLHIQMRAAGIQTEYIDIINSYLLQQAIDTYVQTTTLSPEPAKNVINVLLQTQSYEDKNNTFLNCDLAKCAIKTAGVFEYLIVNLNKITFDKTRVPSVWLDCLASKLTTTLVLAEQPLLAYWDTSHLASTFGDLARDKTFVNLDEHIRGAILSATSPLEPTLLHTVSEPVLENKNPIQISSSPVVSSSQAFNVKSWHGYYLKNIPPKTVTPLQSLAWQSMASRRATADIINDIKEILKHSPNLEGENLKDGYWIETLLVSMHDKKDEDRNLVAQLLTQIPKYMWQTLWDAGIVTKILNTLEKEINPLADSARDKSMYALYIIFILEASLNKLTTNDDIDLINDLSRLFAGLNFNSYDPKTIFKIERYSDITKLFPADDHLQLMSDICAAAKEVLFLPVDSFDINRELEVNFTGTLVLEQKNAVCASIKKSIDYALSFGGNKWQSYAFIIKSLTLLDKFVKSFELNPAQLLPEQYDLIVDTYYWAVTYQNKEDKLPSAFNFIKTQATKRWKGFNAECKIEDKNLNDFIQALTRAGTEYTKPYLMSKANESCALDIKTLGENYSAKTNDEKNITFIKMMMLIIDYRIKCYHKDSNKVEKTFYTSALLPLLSQLGDNQVKFQLSPEHKNKLIAEIINAIQAIGQVPSGHYYSFRETIKVFNRALGINLQVTFTNEGVPLVTQLISLPNTVTASLSTILNDYGMAAASSLSANNNGNIHSSSSSSSIYDFKG